ncbi:c-type cytochrome [Catalinimonas niigatensis]|uniref:c-type cytochrome n=1 Tax=Catalinimonas niigatensis TaxID=1397264 RepID=UPI002666A6EC|nr:c-type cytochrome [Catalinimonas niigatensis]WPP48262.1 c-type cytochrome [Catalinimonas niigatensis]
MSEKQNFLRLLRQLILLVIVLIICVVGSATFFISHAIGIITLEKVTIAKAGFSASKKSVVKEANRSLWQPPDSSSIPASEAGELIRYGWELVTHTSVYLGPKGKVKAISNGMNCQNCHLQAGTVPFGNNYGKVASTYPKLRQRSGIVEGFKKRVNDCIERSLNGQKLEEDSREMQAMVAYIKWVGKDVTPSDTLKGFGLLDLPLLNRPANPQKGKTVYDTQCSRCHGKDGEGVLAVDSLEYIYPPLYGKHSYNTGAGLYRISKFAAFVKANMPYGVSFDKPLLTDEEAWDVAAYINSMPRPEKNLSADWPDISKKPFDHPFGPYVDRYSEEQHKYGPFREIIATKK